MKIEFSDTSFIEVLKSKNDGKILVYIAAKDKDNHIINSVELTHEEFVVLFNSELYK